MPTPLHFTDEEMSLLINLSGPIAPAARPAFMQEVAQELEAAGQGGVVGAVHRIGRVVQRRRPTRALQRRQADRAIWRCEAAGPAARARQLPEGEVAEHP